MYPLDSTELHEKSAFRQIPFSARHAAQALLLAGGVYAAIVTFALLLSRAGVEDHICLALVHAAGAIALFLFWRKGKWGNARFDCFGAALLLMAIAYRIHALLDALIYGSRLETLYRYPNLPVPEPAFDLLLKGEIITVSAFLIIACSWRLKVGKNVEYHSFIHTAKSAPLKISLLVYGCAFFVDIARRIAGVSFGPLDQLTSILFATGVASIYFIAARKRTAIGRVIRASLLALPLSLLALDSGMKSEIFFPFIPAAILLWNNFRHRAARVSAVSAAAILLAVSQLYVHHVRELSWGATGDMNISNMTLVSSFMDNFQDAPLTDALNQISSRVNMTTAHATTVTLADHYGHEPVAVFGLIPASVIPRVLWPEKPVMQPGAMHTARILGHTGPASEMTSSTAAGFAAELYLGGWWIGVVFGAMAYGWLMASAQKWAFRFGPGFAHQAFCFVALYWAIRFDEKHVVYAYTSIIFMTIFVWMLAKATSALGIRGNTQPVSVKR